MKPKLRFPGYEEEWEEKKFDKNTYIKARIGWKNLKAEEYVDDGIPMIAGKHIREGVIDWNAVDYISEERYIESPEIALREKDVIFSKDGTLGNPAYIDFLPSKATINGTMMLVRLSEEKDGVNPQFFYHILKTKRFAKLIQTIKSGGTVPHIFQRDIIDFKFNMPSLPEQEKIGEFFSLLDQRIEKQEEKIELMKERKKGWMQKVFNQEIRFKDENGNDYPDWEEKKLEEISEKIQDGNYGAEYPKTSELTRSGIPFLTAKNISSNEIKVTDYISSHKHSLLKKAKIKENDILLTNRGTFPRPVVLNKNIVDGNIGPQLTLIRISDSQIIPAYVTYYLKTDKFQKNILIESAGSTMGFMNLTKTKNMVINLPSFPEQEKIANFLSTQDELIEKEEEKLNLLKEQKKGLLQQMFV